MYHAVGGKKEKSMDEEEIGVGEDDDYEAEEVKSPSPQDLHAQEDQELRFGQLRSQGKRSFSKTNLKPKKLDLTS